MRPSLSNLMASFLAKMSCERTANLPARQGSAEKAQNLFGGERADSQSNGPQGPQEQASQEQGPRAAVYAQQPPAATRAAGKGRAPEARRLHRRAHHDAQEAEFGASQDRPRTVDQRHRGHRLHPG